MAPSKDACRTHDRRHQKLPSSPISGRLGYACKDDNGQRKSPEQGQCVTFPDASGLKKMMAQVSPPEDMTIRKGEG
jgi:hypothetical protein